MDLMETSPCLGRKSKYIPLDVCRHIAFFASVATATNDDRDGDDGVSSFPSRLKYAIRFLCSTKVLYTQWTEDVADLRTNLVWNSRGHDAKSAVWTWIRYGPCPESGREMNIVQMLYSKMTDEDDHVWFVENLSNSRETTLNIIRFYAHTGSVPLDPTSFSFKPWEYTQLGLRSFRYKNVILTGDMFSFFYAQLGAIIERGDFSSAFKTVLDEAVARVRPRIYISIVVKAAFGAAIHRRRTNIARLIKNYACALAERGRDGDGELIAHVYDGEREAVEDGILFNDVDKCAWIWRELAARLPEQAVIDTAFKRNGSNNILDMLHETYGITASRDTVIDKSANDRERAFVCVLLAVGYLMLWPILFAIASVYEVYRFVER